MLVSAVTGFLLVKALVICPAVSSIQYNTDMLVSLLLDILIPFWNKLDFPSISKNMILLRRQTASSHIFPSPVSCCSIFSIFVLTEAHFRWSVLLRHAPFSSARTTFFTHPTRPSQPQIYCQHRG